MSEFAGGPEKHFLSDPILRDLISNELQQINELVGYGDEESIGMTRTIIMPVAEDNGNNLVLRIDESIMPSSICFKYELFEGLALDGAESDKNDVIPGKPLLTVSAPGGDSESSDVGQTNVMFYDTDPRKAFRMLKTSFSSTKIARELYD